MKNPPPLYPIPPDVMLPSMMVLKYLGDDGRQVYHIRVTLRTHHPERFKISVTSPQGREIAVRGEHTLTEVYPAKLPGYLTLRSSSAPLDELPPGLYTINIETGPNSVYRLPVLLNPQETPASFARLTVSGRTVSWKLQARPGSNKMRDAAGDGLALSLKHYKDPLPEIRTSRELWSKAFDHESNENLNGKARIDENVPAGTYDLWEVAYKSVYMGSLEVENLQITRLTIHLPAVDN